MMRIAVPAGLLLALAAIHPAPAETLTQTIAGNRLEVRMGCHAHVEIQPKADLAGRIEVTATGEDQAELDRLHLTGGDTAVIERGHCVSHLGLGDIIHDRPAPLRLTIQVPAGIPIEINESGAGGYEIGPVAGPLKMTLSGASEVHAAHVTALDLDLSGAANLSIDRADGPGTIDFSGAGKVVIADGTMPKLRLGLGGVGKVQIDRGDIGTLDISLSGVGNAEIHAPVRDAKLSVSGFGHIDIDKVTGTVHRDVSGLGNINIGG
jgi:hypothetical protein